MSGMQIDNGTGRLQDYPRQDKKLHEVIHMRSIFLLATIPAILAAIERVETGGHRCPSRAVGDGGRSLGPMQIQRAYHHDAWGTDRGYERVQDREYARQTVIKYWLRYCPSAYRRGDVSTLARCRTLRRKTNENDPQYRIVPDVSIPRAG
jgi:hypothetical protein